MKEYKYSVVKYNYKGEKYKLAGYRGNWKLYIKIGDYAIEVEEPGHCPIRFKTQREAKEYTWHDSFIRMTAESSLEYNKKWDIRTIVWERDDLL